jgi:hypothetical protein
MGRAVAWLDLSKMTMSEENTLEQVLSKIEKAKCLLEETFLDKSISPHSQVNINGVCDILDSILEEIRKVAWEEQAK